MICFVAQQEGLPALRSFCPPILALAILLALAIPTRGFAQRTPANKLRIHKVSVYPYKGSVTSLDFVQSEATDWDAKLLPCFPDLESVDFSQRPFTDAALKHLLPLKHVREIRLSYCPITNEALQTLAELPSLEELDLSCTSVTDLTPLIKCPKLKKLDLKHCFITDEALEALSEIKSLEWVSLGSTEVTDQGVSWLTRLPKLKSLSLPNARITDEGARKLAECQQLETLQLAYAVGNSWIIPDACQVSAEALQELKESLPRLKVFGEPRYPREYEVVVNVDGQTKNLSLDLKQISDFPDKESVEAISLRSSMVDDASLEFIDQFRNLKRLNLTDTWIQDGTLARVARLTKLEELTLEGTRVTDYGVGLLSTCSRLRKIDLDDTTVTGTGFEQLRNLDQLTVLKLARIRNGGGFFEARLGHSPGVTAKGLAAIAQLKSVKRLNLKNYDDHRKLSQEEIEQLSKMTGLDELELYGRGLTSRQLKQLDEALPNTAINSELRYTPKKLEHGPNGEFPDPFADD